MEISQIININQHSYKILKELGHGKGGYSYLVEDENKNKYVLKQIHHESCSYYQFGNKIESEVRDYNRLNEIGINLPKMIYVDYKREIIIKDFIDGPTIDKLVIEDKMEESYFFQIRKMCEILYKNNLNIDYFPTNFVVDENKVLFYIDYECNDYMDEWNFENWGIKYWSRTDEFKENFKL